MVLWSSIANKCKLATQIPKTLVTKNGFLEPKKGVMKTIVKFSHGHGPPSMKISPPRFPYTMFKDHLNFYFFLIGTPMFAFVTYMNVFVGPSTLEPTPEGYEPEFHEYFRKPVTRLIAKYCIRDLQQDYEKALHRLHEIAETRKYEEIVRKVEMLEAKRHDRQSWFYKPISQTQLNYEITDSYGAEELKRI